MKYESAAAERDIALEAAKRMCAAARTAPKTRGIDKIETLVLTEDELLSLADRMEEIDIRRNGENRTHFTRDANNLRSSQAVVLIGVQSFRYGLNCGYCGHPSCGECAAAGGSCFFRSADLGIAVGSAVSVAADMRIDSRVMFSVGVAAGEMGYLSGDITWLGIPLSISGKSPFFDRK